MKLTADQRDHLLELVQAKRETLNRTAEVVLEDIARLDKITEELVGWDELPSLCPNCGQAGYHESPDDCR